MWCTTICLNLKYWNYISELLFWWHGRFPAIFMMISMLEAGHCLDPGIADQGLHSHCKIPRMCHEFVTYQPALWTSFTCVCYGYTLYLYLYLYLYILVNIYIYIFYLLYSSICPSYICSRPLFSGSLGVKLDFTESSTGAQIREIGPSGHIPTWNAAHPGDAVNLAKTLQSTGEKRAGFGIEVKKTVLGMWNNVDSSCLRTYAGHENGQFSTVAVAAG